MNCQFNWVLYTTTGVVTCLLGDAGRQSQISHSLSVPLHPWFIQRIDALSCREIFKSSMLVYNMELRTRKQCDVSIWLSHRSCVHVNIASAAGFHIFGTKSVLVWGPWWEWGIPICVGVSRGCSGGVRGGGTLVQAYQFEPNNACESEAYPVCNKFDRILAGSFDLESLAMTLVNQIWQCLWAWVR